MKGEELRAIRKRFQIIFQDPYGSLNPRKTIEATLTEPMMIYGIGANADERRECGAALKELEQAAAAAKKANPAQRARRGLVHALLNHNDFVSVR